MPETMEKLSHQGYEYLEEAAGDNTLHITEALDKGEVIGFIAYSYCGDHTVVYDYNDGGELLLCDGLVRSVMFKSCLKGIGKAVFRLQNESGYASLRKLRFLPPDSDTAEDLDSFMNGCENCKKQ